MVSADRLPAVNRLAATFVRPVSGGQSFCGGFRTGFLPSIAFAATFARPVSGCQLSCGGFCTGFLAADRLCSDFARPVSGGLPPCGGFRLSIVLLWFPPARFRRPVSGCQLSCGGFCSGFLAADRLCSDFCPSDSGCMASGACRIASAGQQRPLRFRCARGSRPAVPGFRAVVHPNSGREFRRLPQKILSH